MKTMSVEEIKDMVGTEFNYVMPRGRELPAVIAAFDPEIGFTCLATSFTDNLGFDHSDNVDSKGNLCLIGINKKDHADGEGDFLEKISRFTMPIKNLGYAHYHLTHSVTLTHRATGLGHAACAFN